MSKKISKNLKNVIKCKKKKILFSKKYENFKEKKFPTEQKKYYTLSFAN